MTKGLLVFMEKLPRAVKNQVEIKVLSEAKLQAAISNALHGCSCGPDLWDSRIMEKEEFLL